MNEERIRELNDELESAIDQLSGLRAGTPEYKQAAESVAVLAKLLEAERDSTCEREEKSREAKKESVFRWVKVGLEGLATVGTLLTTVCLGIKTLRFEETGSVASFAGKQILQRIFRK